MTIAQNLTGRVALVTGASSGIGRATAITLAGLGAQLALVGRSRERLDEVASQIEAAGRDALVIVGDVANEATATGAVQQAVKHFGRIDILVNAAGIMEIGGAAAADTAQWRRVMDVNLMAALYTGAAAVEVMRGQKSGDIINISSVAGRKVSGGAGSYCTSKSALISMTEGLRQEVGSDGIRVCVMEPGSTSTGLFESVSQPQAREFVRQQLSAEGVMSAEDVAATIAFIVSLPARVNISEILIRPTMDVK